MNPPPLVSTVFCTLAFALLPACSSEVDCASLPATPAPANAPVATRPAVAANPVVPVRALTDVAVYTEEVTIYSDPSGAAVSIDGNAVGVTPLVATLDTARDYVVTLSKSGYESADYSLKPQTSAMGSSSIKSGGVSPGGTFTKFPHSFTFTLKPAAGAP